MQSLEVQKQGLNAINSASPGEGEDTQLFGFNSSGAFVRMTDGMPPRSVEVVFLDSRSTIRPSFVDSSWSFATPAIQSIEWTGYFAARVYYRILLDSLKDDNQSTTYDFVEIPVVIDSLEATQWRQRFKSSDSTIQLYMEARSGSSHSKSVRLRANSSIEFVNAVHKADSWWLHVVVDGQDGYVGEPDFPTMGLPLAD